MSNALCIGGVLDGKTFESLAPTDAMYYTLHSINIGGTAPLCVYISNDLTTTAAMHMVFAAYAKKGRK